MATLPYFECCRYGMFNPEAERKFKLISSPVFFWAKICPSFVSILNRMLLFQKPWPVALNVEKGKPGSRSFKKVAWATYPQSYQKSVLCPANFCAKLPARATD
jgi:hypothetical protein